MARAAIYALLILISACNTNTPHSNAQEETSSVTVQTDKLQDGWYLHVDKGKQRLMVDDTVYLSARPVVSLDSIDIKDVEFEREQVYADTISTIRFMLTKNGEAKLSNALNSYQFTNVYFILNDSIINLHSLPEKQATFYLTLTLSDSDFDLNAIRNIDSIIRQRIGHEH